MKIAGRVNVVGSKLTWTPGGLAVEPCVTVRSNEGSTRIRLEETLANRGQLLVGAITLSGFTAMLAVPFALVAAKLVGVPKAWAAPIVAAIVIAAALAAFLGVRRLFQRRIRSRTRQLDEAMANVVAAARRSVVVPRRARIDIPAEDDSEVDAEAEAAVEESSPRHARRA
jgi:nitrate reductase gamma subunit